MRKLIVSEFVSLDGVMENPAWTAPYWNDEIARFKHDELFASDVLLLGRVTYEGFAAAWPAATDEEGYADRINSLPKFVVSATLETATWNATLVRDNVVETITALKQEPGQNILLFGSGQFVELLMQHDLVDEYRLLVYPVVLGSGKRLFSEGMQAKLTVTDTKAFSSGVVALTYQTARN